MSGAGNSVAALLGTSTGDVKMLVNDGVISRSLMEIAGLNVGNYVGVKLFGDDEVEDRIAARPTSEMKNGVMTPRVFVFDTENALISITGTADFKNETVDMDITPDSKGFRIFSLRSPLYVRGTFGSPDVGVHALPLAARGAGMVALGVLLTPAAGLLALIAPSTTDRGACGPLLEQMRKPPAPFSEEISGRGAAPGPRPAARSASRPGCCRPPRRRHCGRGSWRRRAPGRRAGRPRPASCRVRGRQPRPPKW